MKESASRRLIRLKSINVQVAWVAMISSHVDRTWQTAHYSQALFCPARAKPDAVNDSPNTLVIKVDHCSLSHATKNGTDSITHSDMSFRSPRTTTRKITSNDTHCVSSKGSDDTHLYVIEAPVISGT
ncbi:hypothetical protein LXL04_029791 [Taraxacum kok-saghyz]